jgi:hypothetical protein
MTSILGPNGTPMVELGGERAWRKRVIGDIVVSYQWIDLRAHGDTNAEDGPEPCMCLYPAHRRLEVGAYTIPQRNAWAYADSKTGQPSEQLYRTAHRAAGDLGFDKNDKQAFFRVLDVICEGIPDLIDMPSEQPSALDLRRHLLGIEAAAKVNGQTIHQELI